MDPARIAALLEPYLAAPLSETQLTQVAAHLDLLLRWNARTNLTSVRDPEHIVTRHFGESFFLDTKLNLVLTRQSEAQPRDPQFLPQLPDHQFTQLPNAVDLGSGAGFPAIPLKILHPGLHLTLVEAHHTKAVFLREVLRALHLEAEVRNVRAETLPAAIADLVTLRAIERFEAILPTAARLLRSAGDSPAPPALALLISVPQIPRAQQILPKCHFQPPIPIPGTQNRVIQLVEPIW